ncbi:MAG: response regulator transcription factor [Rhodocyclaceae bacterium]
MIRIVIADDHPIVLSGLVSVISRELDIVVCGQATDARQLLALVDAQKPDLVVTDYKMPGVAPGDDGSMLVRALRQRYPHMGIIVLTVLESPFIFRLVLKRGANSVLIKTSDASDVLRAIRAVATGKSYMPEKVAAILQSATDTRLTSRATQLTLRETEVVRLFAGGLTVNEIADALNRSKKTVSYQKRCAMNKVGAKTDQDLIDYARNTGLD